MVARPRPNTMVTAMEMKKASVNSGSMPSMVVLDDMLTGIRRLTPALMTARKGVSPFLSCESTSSIKMMEDLTSIPDRLMKPSNAMKPKGS